MKKLFSKLAGKIKAGFTEFKSGMKHAFSESSKKFKVDAKASFLTFASLLPLGLAVPVCAEEQIKEVSMSTIMQQVVNIVTKIFLYIGILLLVWAIGMLVLAFKNEDADSKSRAMMMLVVSVALIGIGTLLTPILKAVGLDAPSTK